MLTEIFYTISFFTQYLDFLQVKNDWIKATSEPQTDNKLSKLADKLPKFRGTKNYQLLCIVPDALHLVGLQQAAVVLHHKLEEVLQEVVRRDCAEVPL